MWPFTSKSGNTYPVVSKVVTLLKETRIEPKIIDKDGKISSIPPYGSNSYISEGKITYKEEIKYSVYTEDIFSDGRKSLKSHIASDVDEEEANKVYDFLIKTKGYLTLNEAVKQETIKQESK